MASSLEQFLSIDPLDEKRETVSVEVRGGQVLDVDVKSLTLEQLKRCKKMSTNTYDNPNGGQPIAQIEEITFAQKLCAQGIVDPPLSNSRLRQKHKVHSNEDLVAALFPTASIIELGNVIVGLTVGSDIDTDDIEVSEGTSPAKVEEAKN